MQKTIIISTFFLYYDFDNREKINFVFITMNQA